MSSSDKIVYAPRAESGNAHSRKVRSTWPKVIATESYLARWQPSAYRLGPSFPRSTAHDHLRPRATNLTLAAHSPAYVSLRVSYYYVQFEAFSKIDNFRNLKLLKIETNGVGGKDKLIAKLIDELSVFYGLAIRRNKDSVKDMKTGVRWSNLGYVEA